MAHAQLGSKQAESPEVAQRLAFIRSLDPDRSAGITFPTKVPGPKALTTNIVWINYLIGLLSAGRPKEGDQRTYYDETMKVVGKVSAKDLDSESTRNATRDTLITMHLDALDNLKAKVDKGQITTRSDFGDSADDLENMLIATQKGVTSNPERYRSYYGREDVINPLRNVLAGASTAVVNVQSTDTTGERREPEVVQRPLLARSSMHLISTSKDGVTVAARPTDIPLGAQSLFGGEQSAGDAQVLVANGAATRVSPSATEAEKRTAAHNIYNKFKSSLQGTEVWKKNEDYPDPTLYPNLYQAMKDLKNGYLESGVPALGRDTMFGDFFKTLDNIYIVKVRQKAIETFRAGVLVNHVFRKNQAKLNTFITKAQNGMMDPVILSLGIELYNAHIVTGGRIEQLEINTETDKSRVLRSQKITGHGNIWGVAPEVTVATGWNGTPILLTVFTEMGYRQYVTGAELTDAAGKRTGEKASATQESFYFSFTGVEFGNPGVEGEKNVPRFERLTVAAEPSAGDLSTIGTKPADFLGQLECSLNWSDKNPTVKWRTLISGLYNYFLQQHIVGGVLTPIDVTAKLSNYFTLYGAPLAVRYEYNIGDTSHTTDLSAQIGVKHSSGFALDVRGGYMMESKASQEQALPTMKGWGSGVPSLSLNLTWTPQETFSPKTKKEEGEKLYSTPKKTGGK